ncbi:HicA toxin of toxin-antitoxin [Singulisphaera sp. GP187]|uniref:type II toxin-antitoxin system HicA family toxin n=1 Tax=Singulisphaera sp. GP187 TaxID=1882752 RepID=UPI0009299DCF|nr:type II toxin-antitoxin system HicA family toxin [Singulisphaera sp. GP187]SIO38642.1 HicA toxin of toxin-antitoxin [Singulisphaera sp. GP187]
MNRKHKKTLAVIFADPLRLNISWKAVESLLIGLGAVITERKGSRILVELNGVSATFHRPHPQKETKHYVVQHLRDFLRDADIDVTDDG